MGRTQYTNAFKAKVLAEYAAGELTAAELSKKHGIAKSLVFNWAHQAKKAGGQRRPPPVLHEDSQVSQLKNVLRKQVIARAYADFKAETGIDLGQ